MRNRSDTLKTVYLCRDNGLSTRMEVAFKPSRNQCANAAL